MELLYIIQEYYERVSWSISWEMDWPKRSIWIASMFTWLNPNGFFFLLGVLKDKAYSWKPRSVGDLKNYIREAFQEINEQRDLCKNVCWSIKGKLQSCVNSDGHQFEQLCW